MREILLVDDDQTLASLLATLLAEEGYALVSADRPSRIRDVLTPRTELILLDVMLPELDGFEVCRGLRESGEDRPIIMLTARGDDLDRIRGLRLGADDYLPKPFNHHELLARIEAVLRRTAQPPRITPRGSGLDAERRVMRLDGREIPLTPMEFRILDALTSQPGRTFQRGDLLNLVDPTAASDSFDRAIDLHVSRLRNKLEANPKQPCHLLTVRGAGYRFEW